MKDSPDSSVIRAVRIAHDAGIKVVIMPGRGDSCKEATIKWMKKYDVPFDLGEAAVEELTSVLYSNYLEYNISYVPLKQETSHFSAR